jgi:membrane protease YdiL (CAAX protease family)
MSEPPPPVLFRALNREALRTADGLADPVLWAALLLGLGAWLLPRPGLEIGYALLLVKAAAEELAFRALLQETLGRILPGRARLGPLTLANLLASAAFALAHLLFRPATALLVFFPALVFGLVWDRTRSLTLVTAVHFLYNALLFWRPLAEAAGI